MGGREGTKKGSKKSSPPRGKLRETIMGVSRLGKEEHKARGLSGTAIYFKKEMV